MSDDEDDFNTCPLCEEEMDLSDRNFLPCPCGYRVCMWCWHHIRENLNGLCPACRTPYNSDPHAFSAVDRDLVVKKNRERKQKEKVEKRIVDKTTALSAKAQPSAVDRKSLHNFRVVQRNLLYVIGLPIGAASEEVLRKPEYFGQYGKIAKVVAHKNQAGAHPTASAYVTFAYKEDARAAIQALDGFWIDGHPLRASFGTTKYCNNFIKNVPCTNPECVYLHELGDDDDRFTKEEIQAGHTKLAQTPGKDQILITGGGGPSGTGRKPISEPILPPPVFIQEAKVASNRNTNVAAELKDAENDISQNSEKQLAQIERRIVEDPGEEKLPSPQSIIEDNESTISNPSQTRFTESDSGKQVEATDLSTFNGLTLNAVFPVPVSSLNISVWAVVLREHHRNLSVNPFGQILYPFSELLNLTIPPVDATANPSLKFFTEDDKGLTRRSEESKESPLSSVGSSLWKTSERLMGEENYSEEERRIRQGQMQSEFMKQDLSQLNSSNTSFTALKQLFPGVNFAYGVVPPPSQQRQIPS